MTGRQSLRLHLVLAAAVTAVLMLLGVGVLLFGPLFFRMAGTPIDGDDATRVGQRLLFLHAHFWPIAGVAVGATVVSTAWVAHHLTAPLVRLRRLFESIGAGRLPSHVALRETDYLIDEVDVLNDMLDRLRARIDEIQRAGRELGVAIDALEKRGEGAPAESLTAAIDRLRNHQHELESALRTFELES